MEMTTWTLKATFIAVQILIGYNLILPLVLYALYALSNKKNTSVTNTTDDNEHYDYAVIVTAYEQTHLVPAVIESILRMEYTNYMVYIVADKCDVSDLKFDDPRVVVLRPPETLASNTRSHFYAIKHFVRAHDILTIIDSDNLVEPQYLNELGRSFDAGFDAVQGVRMAKNLDTTYACLDAARDIYYHFYDGEVLFKLGSSATLAGSGMAFKVSLYRECLEHLDISGAGFDKVLQYEIVSRGHRIAFNERAIVFDEKTTGSEQLVKQRARWINTWFKYVRFGFSLIGNGIRTFDINKLLFGTVLLRPPLFLFLLASVLFACSDIWIVSRGVVLWVAGFTSFLGGFMLAIRHAHPDRRIIRSLVGIPRFVYCQVRALLLARKANQVSVATQHFSDATIKEVQG
jgi:cellulose synthase/poly-beta-1,6-N-acetylglucosamine synthase-like glycosyltransferase